MSKALIEQAIVLQSSPQNTKYIDCPGRLYILNAIINLIKTKCPGNKFPFFQQSLKKLKLDMMHKIEEIQKKMQQLLGMGGAPLSCCKVCRFIVRATPTRKVQIEKTPLFNLYFLYSYCHLFLISSASVRSILCLSFIEPIFA